MRSKDKSDDAGARDVAGFSHAVKDDKDDS